MNQMDKKEVCMKEQARDRGLRCLCYIKGSSTTDTSAIHSQFNWCKPFSSVKKMPECEIRIAVSSQTDKNKLHK